MSHVASIDIEIKDLDALAAACEPLGLELVRGQKTYNWWGRSVGDTKLPDGFQVHELGTCEHAIRIKGTNMNGRVNKYEPYEIGIATRRDGKAGYTMLWDTYNGGGGLVEKVGGTGCDKLRQGYAVEVAMRIAKRQGFRVVKKEIRSDGSVAIVTQR
jgi:hypothetical protein